MFREIQRLLDDTGFLEDQLPVELHYNKVDLEWNKLMSLFKERDDALHDQLSGFVLISIHESISHLLIALSKSYAFIYLFKVIHFTRNLYILLSLLN